MEPNDSKSPGPAEPIVEKWEDVGPVPSGNVDPSAAGEPTPEEEIAAGARSDEEARAKVDPASDPDAPRRPLWLHLIVLLFQVLILIPLYAAIILAAVGGGVGWHYFDQSAPLDLDLVARPQVGARVLDATGAEIGRAGSLNQLLIAREEIPPHFVDALLAAEDQRFFSHPGFDPVGSFRAALANYRSEAIREGGSTVTQQLARDVYRLEGRNIDRKLSEIAAAVRIEKRYSKDEILVHYLNRVYFGSGFYGLGAAARGYFGKPVSRLTLDESAMLCGIIPAPSPNSPFVNFTRAGENRDKVLRRMHEIGKLPESELRSLLTRTTPVASSREDSLKRGQIAYLISRAEREMRAEMAAWQDPPESLEGYTVETAVNLVAQQEAVKMMDRHLAELEKESGGADPLEAAFVLLDNRSGQVVLAIGSRDFQRSEYDRAAEMKRPPGSAFLPFLYAAAYESGPFTPATRLLDAPFDNREIGLGAIGGVLGEWSTENPENRWQGEITAAEALARSKNSPSARLALRVGLENTARLARACGITSELRPVPGSLLGSSEASLLELTRAYTTFANGGTPAPEPRFIRRILDPRGQLRSRAAAGSATPEAPAAAMKESTARAVAGCLAPSTAVPGGSGKSGTTATFTDVWHFGFDQGHTWGLWIGRDRFSPIRPMAFGGEIATPLAEAIVSRVLGGKAPVASAERP